ncbi:MAG: hypothetical protein EXR90_07450 [Methyloglobulus sp.]|nr:hypothetical protein [Methyloglobulus sp.]
MKNFNLAMTVLAFAALMPLQVMAGESDVCKSCHNGSMAPSVDTLKSRYKTADELVAAAMKVTNPMMKAIQADEAKLKAAAAEIVK